MNGVEQRLGQVGARVSALKGLFVGLASAAGIGLAVSRTTEAARVTVNYANALDISTEALSQWQFAGERVGLQAEKIGDIMKDTAEKIGDAWRNGAGEAKEALETLGIPLEEIVNLSADQQLIRIAGALDQVGTQAEKIQILESLASDASLLLPLLEDDAARLRELTQRADELGVTLTDLEAGNIIAADEAVKDLNASMDGLAQTMTAKLAPQLTRFINWLSVGIPAAYEFAQPAFEGIGNDIFRIWQRLNPSEITLPTTLEDALNRQVELNRKLELLKAANADAGVAKIQKEIIENDRLVKQLQLAEKIERENREKRTDPTTGPGLTIGVSSPGLSEAELADLEKRFDRLNERLKSDEQKLSESFLMRHETLRQALENDLITQMEFDELEVTLAAEHEKAITAIVKKGLTERQKFQLLSAKQQTQIVLGELVTLTQGVAQHNRGLFELNKAAGIAQAIINMHEGVSETLSKYPWPLAGLMAAAHAAAGLVRVKAIESASYSGGGSAAAPSLAGTGGGAGEPINTVPATPPDNSAPADQGPQVTVIIEGSAFGDEQVREIIVDAVREATNNDEF